MKETLLRCYPDLSGQRVLVLTLGHAATRGFRNRGGERGRTATRRVRRAGGCIGAGYPQQDQSREGPRPAPEGTVGMGVRGGPGRPLWLFICGEAAFMQGGPFLAKLKLMAERLRRIKVVFCGYVSGARKAGFLRMADLYVFPSRHESYGLTLMEAMGAGLPSVALEHDGSRESLAEECGVMIPAGDSRGVVVALAREIEALAANPATAGRDGLCRVRPRTRAAVQPRCRPSGEQSVRIGLDSGLFNQQGCNLVQGKDAIGGPQPDGFPGHAEDDACALAFRDGAGAGCLHFEHPLAAV